MVGEQVSFHRASLNRPISEIRSSPASGGEQVGLRRSMLNRPVTFDASILTSIRPSTIGGATLTFWGDATQGQGLADNDPVASWTDRGQYNQHFLQATAGNKPTYKANAINGRPAIYFTTDDYMTNGASLDTNTAQSVFAVIKPVSFPTSNATLHANGGIFADDAGYSGVFLTANGGNGVGFYNYDGNADTFKLSLTAGTPYVIHMRHDGTNLFGSVNGGAETSTASGTRGNFGNWVLGSCQGFGAFIDCYISEVVVFNVALTARPVKTMINSLKTKYGIN